MISGRIIQGLDLLDRLRLLSEREAGSIIENGLNVQVVPGGKRVLIHLRQGPVRARYDVAVNDQGLLLAAPALEVTFDPNNVTLHHDERQQLTGLLRRIKQGGE